MQQLGSKTFPSLPLSSFYGAVACLYTTMYSDHANNDFVTFSEGVLRDDSGMLVIKPCLPKEVAFYESSIAHHPELAFWMPTFMGTLQLNETNTLSIDSATPTTTPDVTAATPKTPLPTSIVLANLTHPFVRPCVLDIKLGAQLWDDSAPLSKRERLDAVAASTTSKPLGLRIAGMKVWKGERDGYQIYDKQYGRQFTPENVIDGFKEFFSGASLVYPDPNVQNKNVHVQTLNEVTETKTSINHTKSLAARFFTKVHEIQLLLESLETRMYSASLLFVYEGDPVAYQTVLESERQKEQQRAMRIHDSNVEHGDEDEDENEGEDEDDDDDDDDDEEDSKKLEELKLIDFAHADWTPGQGPDENMLHGVKSVVKLLKQVCND